MVSEIKGLNDGIVGFHASGVVTKEDYIEHIIPRHLNITLDKEKHILTLEPQGVLTEEDFQALSNIVDPYLVEGKRLKGLMIKSKSFPGWDSLTAIKGHIKFIKEHHEKIDKLAFVTDSSLIDVMKTIAGVLVHPTIKEFKYNALDEAYKWLKTSLPVSP